MQDVCLKNHFCEKKSYFSELCYGVLLRGFCARNRKDAYKSSKAWISSAERISASEKGRGSLGIAARGVW